MNKEEARRAFGTPPERLKGLVQSTLHELEEGEPMKRNSIRFVLLTILILALLVGVAIAATAPRGIVDFVERWGLISLEESTDKEIKSLISAEEEPLALAEAEGITLAVTSAMYDGQHVYVTMRLAPAKRDKGIALLGEKDIFPDIPFTERFVSTPEHTTVSLSVKVSGASMYPLGMIENEDGSIDIFGSILLENPSDEDVRLVCKIKVADEDGKATTGSTYMLVKNIPNSSTRHVLAQEVAVPGMPVTIIGGEMTVTPLSTNYMLEYLVGPVPKELYASMWAELWSPTVIMELMETENLAYDVGGPGQFWQYEQDTQSILPGLPRTERVRHIKQYGSIATQSIPESLLVQVRLVGNDEVGSSLATLSFVPAEGE